MRKVNPKTVLTLQNEEVADPLTPCFQDKGSKGNIDWSKQNLSSEVNQKLRPSPSCLPCEETDVGCKQDLHIIFQGKDT